MRPERVWIENVQPFAHNVLLRHAVFENEGMDGRDFGAAAGCAHPSKAGLEVLERRQLRTLRAGRLAAQPFPESFHQLRRHAYNEHRRPAGEVPGPGAELGELTK